MRTGVTRRQFIEVVSNSAAAIAGLGGPAVANQFPSAPANVKVLPSARALLQPSQFEYLGGFRLARTIDLRLDSGLTVRQVGGRARLMVSRRLVEFTVPSALGSGDWNSYPVVEPDRTRGEFWSDKMRFEPLTGGGGYNFTGGIRGLFWDEEDKVIYASFGDDYWHVGYDQRCTTFCAAKFADGDTSVIPLASWRVAGTGFKAVQGGITRIPKWFAEQYLNGKSLGVGFGGYFSLMSSGDVSLGPALHCVVPPTLPQNPHLSTLLSTKLLGYTWSARARRDTDYVDDYEGVNPVDTDGDGVVDRGYWFWNDLLYQGGCWIDTGKSHGLLFAPYLGHGRGWYNNSQLNGDRGRYWFFLYDPMDLAKVATGQWEPSRPQPVASWPLSLPGNPDPEPTWGSFFRAVKGVAYDSSTRRLYLGVSSPVEYWLQYPTIHVWQLND